MDEITEADLRKIEQIHSNWIEFEVAGEDHSLMALCADDIDRLVRPEAAYPTLSIDHPPSPIANWLTPPPKTMLQQCQ